MRVRVGVNEECVCFCVFVCVCEFCVCVCVKKREKESGWSKASSERTKEERENPRRTCSVRRPTRSSTRLSHGSVGSLNG